MLGKSKSKSSARHSRVWTALSGLILASCGYTVVATQGPAPSVAAPGTVHIDQPQSAESFPAPTESRPRTFVVDHDFQGPVSPTSHDQHDIHETPATHTTAAPRTNQSTDVAEGSASANEDLSDSGTNDDGPSIQVVTHTPPHLNGTSDGQNAPDRSSGSPEPNGGGITNEDSSIGEIVAEQGATITVKGAGYKSGAIVYVWVFSTPTLLGHAKVNDVGHFEGSFTLPDSVLPGGHSIVVIGEIAEHEDATHHTLRSPLTVVERQVSAPEPATLTYADGAVKVDYNADQVWLRLNGEWITASLADPIVLNANDTLTAQVRNCLDDACSDWAFSSYTVNVAADPDAPVITFDQVDDYSGQLDVVSDAEEFEFSLDGNPVVELPVAVTGGETFSVSARNCGGLDVCSDWVTATYTVSVGALAAAPELALEAVDSYSGTMTVVSDDSELELFIDGEQVSSLPDLVFGDQVITAQARNCADVCSEWVVSEHEVTVAESPETPEIVFTSLSPYAGQLEVSSLAEEVEAVLNGERVEVGLVAVVGGDVLKVRSRNCAGADVCSQWIEATHEVSVDAAPDAADIIFSSEGPYSGTLGYTVTADEVVATFNGTSVDVFSFAVTGGETLRVEARNCLDAETCSEWVVAERTVSVASTPDAAALTYNNEFIDISHEADELEISFNGADFAASGAVSWGVDVGDTLDVRVRNCEGFDICSVWVDSDYLVTQAEEPTAASIVFDAIDSYTGNLIVTHDADEAVMTLDGETVTGAITAVGHQELVVNIRDCDGFDVCSDWVESRYTVSVAATPEAADIAFARTTDFAGELTVTHFAEEQILDLDGDTAVVSPVTVTGLETLDVQIRNCAGADVCSPWVPSTRNVTVAPVPTAPAIAFTTTGDYSRDLGAVVTADKSEARLDGSVVTLPVTVAGSETLVVQAWNCDGYDICSNPASSVDSHTVTVAQTPAAADLVYNNEFIDISHSAEDMELSTDGGSTYNASAATSWGVDVGDTVDVRVRNCDGYDICSVWVDSDYLVTQAAPADAATFTFTLLGDYSAEVEISHGAENITVTVDGETHNGLTVPVTGGEQIEVAVWDCTGFDICSEPITSTYNVDVASTPEAAVINFSSTGEYEDSGTLTLDQGAAEQMRQWFNSTTTTDTTFTVVGGETLLAEVRNCGTDQQICSVWVPSTHFVSTDEIAAAAILTFVKVDDDNGTITVAHGTDEILLNLDGVTVTGAAIGVTAGQKLTAETRNCADANICSEWTEVSYTVSVATQPSQPVFEYTSTGDYSGTVNIIAANFQDRVETTLNGSSVSLPVAVEAADTVVVQVRGCDDGDLCSPWSSNTYIVSQAASTTTPAFTATRVGGNFDSVSTEINVAFAGAEELEIYADSTSGTLLSDSSSTITIAKTDGYSSITARSRNCAGSDVCSPWVPATMPVTTATTPAQPTIDLNESGFAISAAGDLDRSSLNSAAFVEASGDLTFVAGVENDTLTVETRNCGDVSAFTFCSGIMSVGPVTYIPAPEAAVVTFSWQAYAYEVPDKDDYLLEVDFDADFITISTTHIAETTFTEAEFTADYPNGIWCKPETTYPLNLGGCWLDVKVWNESGAYSSAVVPSPRFTIVVPSQPPQENPFTFNFDTETGELLSVVPRVTPTNAHVIADLFDGTTTWPGPFTCETDWTCPNAFDNIIGNTYPAGTTLRYRAENWQNFVEPAHIPYARNAIEYLKASPAPASTTFGSLTTDSDGASQTVEAVAAHSPDANLSTGTFEFAYSTDGGTSWVGLGGSTGSTVNANLDVSHDALYPGGVAVPSLDFRVRYCADSQYDAGSRLGFYTFFCSAWDTIGGYTRADLTAADPDAPSLSWDSGNQAITVSNATNHVEYSTDGTTWSTTPFGTITTAGTYYVRHRNCGTATDNPCDTNGQNVFGSGWVTNSYTVTQATQPTVSITVDQSTSESSISTSAGDITYDIDGGAATSYTAPFAVTAGETVNVSAVDCSADLCSTADTGTLEVTQNAAPTLSVSINEDTGETTVSAGSATGTTYDIGSGVEAYTAPFTVTVGTAMTVTAVDCSAVLCSETATVVKTVTQAAAPTDAAIAVNVENSEVTISAPSATTPKITYNTGGSEMAYTGPFSAGDGVTVNASAYDCAADLCSAPDTASATVTYGTTPTVTISMDDSGNLIASTDHAAANTEIRYGWDSSTVTTAYSAPLTTSDYSFGDTLYVQARSIDGANVWSPWSASESFDTMGSTVSAAATTTPNSDWTEMTFTSTGNDIEYQIHSSYDDTGETSGWTAGTSATIRDNTNGVTASSFLLYSSMVSVAEISTRARDCVNVNVESSCSTWVEELNVTYGTERLQNDTAVNAVADGNGDITDSLSFFCDFHRCMPITEVQWSYEIDTNSADDSTSLSPSDTFQVLRNSAGYTVSASDSSSGDLTVTAIDGTTPTGDLGSAFGTVSNVASGTVTLPVNDQRIKWVHTFARWAGSSTLLTDKDRGTNWSPGYSW